MIIRFARAATMLAAALLTTLLAPLGAQSGTGAVVISQLYGGGGNSGSTYTNDFVELFNRSAAAVNVSGWSVQYASSAGTWWALTELTGTIPAGGYYLVRQAQGLGGTTALPTPDAVGTIAMSATAGKVALVSTNVALAGACPATAAALVDLVGFGPAATCFEGAPTPALSNTTAALRLDAGCTDTQSNASNFAVGAPLPHNSTAPLRPCGGGSTLGVVAGATPSSVPQGRELTVTGVVNPASDPDSSGLLVQADLSAVGGSATYALFDDGAGADTTAGDNTFTGLVLVPAGQALGTVTIAVTATDAQSRSATDDVTATVIPPPVVYLPHDVQGPDARSPFPVGTVATVEGVVTARKYNGFFVQTAAGFEDANPLTSEGVFVFTSGPAPTTAVVGRLVQVTGTVAEFVPGSDATSPPLTELVNVSAMLDRGEAPLPAPVMLTSALLSSTGAFDQLERFEGMRVAASSMTAVSGTGGTKSEANATSTSDGAFSAVLTGTARPFREAGIELPLPIPAPVCAAGPPCAIPVFDGNPERLRVDTDALEGLFAIDVSTGAVTGAMVGPLDFGARAYTVLPETAITITGGMVSTVVPAPAASQFTVASFNMERFFDTVNDAGTSDVVLTPIALERRLAKASIVVRESLQVPDVLAVQEVENVSVLATVADRLNLDRGLACPGAAACYRAILEEGNDPGGIDVGFLLKERVSVIELTQWGKDLMYSYPHPTPANPDNVGTALLNDRPSLTIRATVQAPEGRLPADIIVVVNHLRSLNGVNDPADGLRVRTKRQAQAEFLAGVLQSLQETWPLTSIVSVGDYNAFELSDGYVDVLGTVGGVPAPATEVVSASPDLVSPDFVEAEGLFLSAPERYSYVFNGSAQSLDHVLVSASARAPNAVPIEGIAHARLNADFPEVWRGVATRPERLSDHDPVVAYFAFPADRQPPVLAGVPMDLVLPATAVNGAVATFTLPTAADDVDGVVPVTCAPPSGAVFPVGDTTVTCTATDAAGNSASASFAVRVTPLPANAGHMIGAGTVGSGSTRAAFAFDIRASATGSEGGWLVLQAWSSRGPQVLVSLQVSTVSFVDDATATFAGTGWWNGRQGYAFEVRAADAGEPGRGRDTIAIVVRAPNGTPVLASTGTLRDGNIQALQR